MKKLFFAPLLPCSLMVMLAACEPEEHENIKDELSVLQPGEEVVKPLDSIDLDD